jgi:hypothetical protein
MITQRYRRDYDGEFVVASTNIQGGVKLQQREWIPNKIQNMHVSGRAAVIGSTNTRHRLDYTVLQHHHGGLMGRNKLQTYGCSNVWKDMRLDFYVSTDPRDINLVHKANYDKNTTVYTTSRQCIRYPESFFLVPYQPQLEDLVTAVYLAAFDQHQEIFLIGYNNDTAPTNTAYIDQMQEIFKVYNSIKFVLVGVAGNMPDMWRRRPNVRVLTYNEFKTYADV